MIKVKTTRGVEYLHTGEGRALLKRGLGWDMHVVLSHTTSWPNGGPEDKWATERPRVGHRWTVLSNEGEMLITDVVVSITDYSTWCRHVDQPTLYVCEGHIRWMLGSHLGGAEALLSTSYHTFGDCDLCIAEQDQYERGLE